MSESRGVFAFAVLMGLAVLATGCSPVMDTQLIRYPEAEGLASRDPYCEGVWIVSTTAEVPADCREVGDVFVGDTGFSTDCQLQRVLDEVHGMTCELGANLAQYEELDDRQSNCSQVRARLFVCESLGKEPSQ